MGVLLQEITAKAAVRNRGGRCTVRVIVEDLQGQDPEAADDLLAAVGLTHISARTLVEALYDLKSSKVLDRLTPARVENAIRRHRRGECVCARAAEVRS
jgi:hypothetical protein